MQTEQQYISDRALASRYQVARSTIWRWAANSQIPQPVKINGSTRWRLSDIKAWEAKQGGAV